AGAGNQPEVLRGDVLDAGIDAAAWRRDALDLADHRRALEVLQADFQLRLATGRRNLLVAADVAFVLQDVEHPGAQLGSRRADGGFATHLRVADAGQHIAERIVHRHTSVLLTSST